MRTETLLQLLKDKQAEVAQGALSQPADRDAFEYGRVVGLHGGLELAIQTLVAAFTEERVKDI